MGFRVSDRNLHAHKIYDDMTIIDDKWAKSISRTSRPRDLGGLPYLGIRDSWPMDE